MFLKFGPVVHYDAALEPPFVPIAITGVGMFQKAIKAVSLPQLETITIRTIIKAMMPIGICSETGRGPLLPVFHPRRYISSFSIA